MCDDASRKRWNRVWSSVDHDVAIRDGRCRAAVVGLASLIVIDHQAGGLVPNLDAEFVHAAAPLNRSVDRRQQEGVVTLAVDGAGSLVLSLRAAHDKPIVAAA